MRFLVLMFGFIGCIVTLVLGGVVFFSHATFGAVRDSKLLDEPTIKQAEDFILGAAGGTGSDAQLTGIFLFIGAAMVFLGMLLGFLRCGWQGALLMLASLVGPGILNWFTLVGLAPVLAAGLMSFFVRPLPITPEDDEDDDED